MLRNLLLHLSHARWARQFITHFRCAWRTASRFVAGETVDDAIAVIRTLNAKGRLATVDHLGENVTNAAEAGRAADDYVFILGKIAESGVCANVSIKLTQFGLDLGDDCCAENVRRVLEKARDTHNFVRIDMEGTPYTSRTLAIYHRMRQEFDNVGVVLQAYLFRTERDLLDLTDHAPPARIRLCKGAYNEPVDKAFPHKADVDASFAKLARLLLDRARLITPLADDGRIPPLAALATHDERLIAAAKTYAAEHGVAREHFEFQMLHGIRRELQEQLAAEGYAVRVYVPFGTEWYPYFMRRLAERPANLWFFLSNLFRR
jgi:proline dehydrogenase